MDEDDKHPFETWVDRYVAAWNSNLPEDIASLFTRDAVYSTGPFDPPWRGPDEIVKEWLARRDEPGTTEFSYEVVAVSGNTGIVVGETEYEKPPTTYANVWLIRLDERGNALEYREWWMERNDAPADPG